MSPLPTDALSALRATPADPYAGAPTSALGRDSFLKLLTTQMQNQDPLDPMSNQDFVAQLAQFSSVEQLMSMSTAMDNVYMGIAAMNNAAMAGLVGTHVEAVGSGFTYDGSPETLHFDAPSSAVTGTVYVHDSEGRVVDSFDLKADELSGGAAVWDPKPGTVPDGVYTFDVQAANASGDPVEVVEHIVGAIDAMDYSTGVPLPSVDGVTVALADILKLTAE